MLAARPSRMAAGTCCGVQTNESRPAAKWVHLPSWHGEKRIASQDSASAGASSGLNVDDAELHCVVDHFHGIAQLELVENRRAVLLDRARTEREQLADSLVGPPVHDQPKNLLLAFGEGVITMLWH